METERNKKVVLRFNREFLEAGNPDILKEIIAEDFINHTAAGTLPSDITGLIQFIRMIHDGFSDLHVEIHDQLAENDLVATRKTIHATHTGEIMGHQPTGKKVSFNVMDFVRLRNGKYVAHWGRNDIMQVIQGL